jgi:surface carbohydrate biosynthesis protein (TIGR04326 family)
VTDAVVVWDQAEDPPVGSDEVLCWQSYLHGDAVASVPGYLEAHAQRIRSRYLAFVHELGESRIAGRRLIDHLDAGDGYSFWWMTTIAEKSPLKSPRIYDCLRMFALEEMLAQRQVATLTLVSADPMLARTMRATCLNLNIGFRWQQRGRRPRLTLRRVYELLPYALKALLSLRHVAMRWPLRKVRSAAWYSGDASVFICSYFIHLDAARGARGEFHSRQWENLPQLLRENGRQLNWLQLFLFSAAVPDSATGLSWVRRFNADAHHQGCHAFVDSYLSAAVVLRALARWLWLCGVALRLREFSAACRPSGSALWLWPLLRADWRVSMSGQTGMANCLAVAQFDAALAAMPRQPNGLYLYENQAWERALLRAWRKYGHGRIIGVQHATAPFWHLYYFDDPRSLSAQQHCAPPLPDLLAVNGAGVLQGLLDLGYPSDRLVAAEAMRYLNLSGLAARRAAAIGAAGPQPGNQRNIKVLVLGDLIPNSVRHLLGLLEAAMPLLSVEYDFTFKPHPGYAIDLAAYPRFRAHQTRDPLAQILAGFDIAVAANSTSAAVDAYVAGLPVIISLDGDELNLSPLRGESGVRFVTSSQELAQALDAAGATAVAPLGDRSEFFFLDAGLPRWKRLMLPVASD